MLCASATLLFLCCNQVATAARMLKTRRSHKAWTWRYRIHLVEDCKTKQKNMQSYFGIKTGLGPIIKRIPLFNWRSSIYTILHWVIGIRRKLIRPCQPLPSHNGCRKICGVVLDLLGFRHPLQSPCNESAMNVKLSNDFNGEGGFARDQTCCSIDMSVKKEKKGKKIDSHQSHHSHVIFYVVFYVVLHRKTRSLRSSSVWCSDRCDKCDSAPQEALQRPKLHSTTSDNRHEEEAPGNVKEIQEVKAKKT